MLKYYITLYPNSLILVFVVIYNIDPNRLCFSKTFFVILMSIMNKAQLTSIENTAREFFKNSQFKKSCIFKQFLICPAVSSDLVI